MYPTLPDTGSFKVAQSLAEIHATDSEAAASHSLLSDDGARKKLKLALSSSPSAAALDGTEKKALSEVLDMDVDEEMSTREKGRPHGGALTESEAESILAAFLGTTPIGKKAAAASAQRTDTPAKAPGSATTTKTTAATSAPAATQSNTGTPSKRRSSRRDTTQSFGEKLPDLLTKTAPFDFTVMGYFQSIDRPGRTEQTLVEDSEDE
ncbi:hypothetical protein PSEUBRA_003250 [Kalmanozyma brasiliensis GHG001]|uniref:Uncharacterized protein n=1 Tax=Kalmanozyma brasiliensis (strain GHG001) TaxID=1365824 RepID=V5EVV6_KALBG|nr:uncharacterized protein PSEUBRA_003250 [Kalmanozyma brasiliensis GHG001]EST07423.1 hypothetical protein PSEUBRA_003250 [Kalmanozyma brasiliensis GHG001]